LASLIGSARLNRQTAAKINEAARARENKNIIKILLTFQR